MPGLGRRADAETVHGHCAPRFERLRDALADAIATGAEVGAALAVHVDGNAVIDLWGGHADGERKRTWESDTLDNLYYVGKAVTAVCALRLVEAGNLTQAATSARNRPLV